MQLIRFQIFIITYYFHEKHPLSHNTSAKRSPEMNGFIMQVLKGMVAERRDYLVDQGIALITRGNENAWNYNSGMKFFRIVAGRYSWSNVFYA
jgi:hypothetical protein